MTAQRAKELAVSSIHAYLDPCDQVEPASARLPIAAIESLRIAVTGRAARLFAGALSEHRLQDMGFERDWDGSVIPKQR
jgi:hypothetical protein